MRCRYGFAESMRKIQHFFSGVSFIGLASLAFCFSPPCLLYAGCSDDLACRPSLRMTQVTVTCRAHPATAATIMVPSSWQRVVRCEVRNVPLLYCRVGYELHRDLFFNLSSLATVCIASRLMTRTCGMWLPFHAPQCACMVFYRPMPQDVL